MQQMKIGIVVPGFSAHEQDWAIPALLDFVHALSVQAEVHVFTLRWPEIIKTYPIFNAVVHALGGKKHLGVGAARLYKQTLKAIAAEHRRKPFTVLHAFWADEPGWVAALAGKILHIPVVISLAGGELVGMKDIGYGLQLLPGRRSLVHWSLNSAQCITAGSNYLIQMAETHMTIKGRSKLKRIPLGVDTKRFFPDPLQAAQLHIPDVILNVGSLSPVKNQRVLIEALQRAPGHSLKIAGQGSLLADLAAYTEALDLSNRAEFLGKVEYPHMPELYRQAGVLVQSSRHEAQGMAVLEAAACGVPVVGTSVGVLPEIGIEANNSAEMIQGVTDLLRDPALRRTVSESSRQKILEEFSLELCIQRFMDTYSELEA